MFCNQCGAQQPEGSKFCNACGQEVATTRAVVPGPTAVTGETKICHACRKRIPADASICSFCGIAFGSHPRGSGAPTDSRGLLERNGINWKWTAVAVVIVALVIARWVI